MLEEAEKKRQLEEEKRAFMNYKADELLNVSIRDFMYKDGVKEVMERLDYDLVGLKSVKNQVQKIANMLVIDRLRQSVGFVGTVPTLHMSFTGAPGTGKTTVARRMGEIFHTMGYSRKGHVILAGRDELVGQYVGHTAPKTREVIKKASGGVLFIDEAYYLYNAANDRDYGIESIEIIMKMMDTHPEDLIVLFAGYKDLMDLFFSYIPGLSARVCNHISFPNYEPDELVEIAKIMTRTMRYGFTEEAQAVFREFIEKRMNFMYFSNARTVRNALDRARMVAARRLFMKHVADPNNNDEVEMKDICELRPEDFQVMVDEINVAPPDAILA
jgi:probable Rubsico expression protein CbbX